MQQFIYLKRLLLLIIMVISSISCMHRGPLYNWKPAMDNEELRVDANKIGLKLKWKWNVGTSRPGRQEYGGSLIGVGPTIKDGNIYFISRSSTDSDPILTVLKEDNGEKVAEYRLPKMLAGLDHMIKEPDGHLLIPLMDKSKWLNHFVKINPETAESTLFPDSYPLDSWHYWKGKILWSNLSPALDHGFNNFLTAQDAVSQKISWQIRPFVHSVFDNTSQGMTIVHDDKMFLYRFKSHEYSLMGRWEIAVVDLNDGHVLWQREFDYGSWRWGKFFNNANQMVDVKNSHYSMFVDKNLYLIHWDHLAEINGWTGSITAINPSNGQIVWKKTGIYPIRSHEAEGELYQYYVKANEPDVLRRLNIETGEEVQSYKLHLRVPESAFLISNGTIGYISYRAQENKKPPYVYLVIDSQTGNVLWTLDVGSQFPEAKNVQTLWYLGETWIAGGNPYEEKQRIHRILAIDEESMLSSAAIAIDHKTGSVLWKVKLEGQGKPLIERILVDGNKIFVKSLNGWLYALEAGDRTW